MANKRRKKRKRAETCRSTELENDLNLDYNVVSIGENGEKYLPGLICEAKALQSFRNLGYKNDEAVGDIIDNSIENNATVVDIKINWNEDGVYGEITSMFIGDNGGGMNEERLINALAVGSISIKDALYSLYGMGLTTAPLSFARTTNILTRVKCGCVWKGVLDLDALEEGKHRYVVKANAEEIRLFEQNIKNITGSPNGSGTVLIITNLDGIKTKTPTSYRKNIENYISYAFRKLIKSDEVCFYVNGNEVLPIDPVYDFELENQETKIVHLEEGDITLNMVELKNLGKKESKDKGIGMGSRGFHVLRNNRGIEGPITYGLLSRGHELHHFRCELCFTQDLDKLFALPLQKNKIIIPDDVKGEIKEAIKDFVKRVSKNTVAFREKNIRSTIYASKIRAKKGFVVSSVDGNGEPKSNNISNKKLNKIIDAWGDVPIAVQNHILELIEDCLASV